MDKESRVIAASQRILEKESIPFIQNYYKNHKFNLKRNIFITSLIKKTTKGPYKITNLAKSIMSEGCFETVCNNYFDTSKPKILVVVRGKKFIWVKSLSLSHSSDFKLADFQAYYETKKKVILNHYKKYPVDPDKNHWIIIVKSPYEQGKILGPLYLYEVEDTIPDYILTYENIAGYETGNKINIHMMYAVNKSITNYEYVYMTPITK